jgi:hypothetical protein
MTIATTNKARGKPEFHIRKIIDDSGNPGYMNRLLIGTATTGLVRIEWVGARYTATTPVNWSLVEMTQQIPTYMPLRYLVADAQNLIVKMCVEKDYEWLLLLEHDVLIQPDCFMRLNEYMLAEDTPLVSGLYYTRAHPSQPLVFRGRGNGYYFDWEHGDVVMCDGVPTGLLLVHAGILRLMWNDAPEYSVYGTTTRRVFETPREMWLDPQYGNLGRKSGTSDLDWCTRLIEGDYLRKAGWNDWVDNLDDERYPIPLDTNIFARHINHNGEQFP